VPAAGDIVYPRAGARQNARPARAAIIAVAKRGGTGACPTVNEGTEVNIRHIVTTAVVVIVVAVIAVSVYSALRDIADLKVGHITANAPDYPDGAIPYALPLKRLVIATTTKITGCNDTQDGEEILGNTNLSIADLIEIDPEQRYYIYFQSSSRGKSLDYQVETYENGTLKSVSTAIRDQVAPITAAVVGAFVKFIPVVPLPPAPPPPPPPQSNCADLSAAIAHNKEDVRLTIREEIVWTPYSAPWTTQTVSVSFRDSLQREFNLKAPHWRWPNAELRLYVPDVSGSAEIDYFSGDSGNRRCVGNIPPQSSGPDGKPCLASGLILRNPAVATLQYWVCDAACDALQKVTPAPKVATAYQNDISGLTPYPSTAKIIPQLGKLLILPVHSGYAQDAGQNVGLSADGLITKLQLKSESALAANITSLGESAKTATSALAPAGTSITQANKNLGECLAAQKTVVDHGGTPIGTCH
jgi:hypothetical protein